MAFGANFVITRRGVLRASSNYIATISVLIGPLFFIPITAITGELFRLHQLHWKVYLFWALSGIVHFALGRTWAYRSIQLLGANRSNIVTSLSPIATIALAMIILKERVTALQLVGIVLTLSGPLLIVLKEQTHSKASQMTSGFHSKEVDLRTLLLGVAYGIGAAIFWGSSSIFIKFALQAGGTPVGGSLIAYTAACLVISPSFLFIPENRRELLSGDRRSLAIGIYNGLSVSIAQLLRYLSLQYGSVIVVSLMVRTTSLWVLLLSFIFNREYESFSRWVLLGNGLLMIGAIMVIIF